jgi:hypothetical protein
MEQAVDEQKQDPVIRVTDYLWEDFQPLEVAQHIVIESTSPLTPEQIYAAYIKENPFCWAFQLLPAADFQPTEDTSKINRYHLWMCPLGWEPGKLLEAMKNDHINDK